MLSSIRIQGFKGFKDTRIEHIRKVNLILGGQNVGKTSLLEAVYLGANGLDGFSFLPKIFRPAEENERDSERFVGAVWKNKNCVVELTDAALATVRVATNEQTAPVGFFGLGTLIATEFRAANFISGDAISDGSIEVALRKSHYPTMQQLLRPSDAFDQLSFRNPLTVSVYLPKQKDLVQLFDRVVMSRKKRKLLDMLKRIEPRLEDMHSLSPDGEQRIYVELTGEGEALPLPLLGHGFSRLVHLYCSLLVSEAKLALIDEVENGIHYSSLPTLFQGIQDIAANSGVQTMMTTHSWECIRAAYNIFASAGKLEDFQLIRLEREADNIRAVVINDAQLVAAMEAGYEIR